MADEPGGKGEYGDPPREPKNQAYKRHRTSVSLARAVAGTRTGRNRYPDGSPRPTSKVNYDRFYVSRLKATYISSEDVLTLEELGKELAEHTRTDETHATNFLKAMARGEGWREARAVYWENLHERALASKAAQTIEQFESDQNRRGRLMVEKAERALMVLEPKDVTEALLLMKLGQDTVYRANRVPARISRYLNVGEQESGQKNLQQELQDAPKDKYAAAIRSDLAALTAEVGASAAPAGGDD